MRPPTLRADAPLRPVWGDHSPPRHILAAHRARDSVVYMVEITRVNPAGLVRNPAFSHAVVVSGPARTIYVGGQNGVDADGAVVGTDAYNQTLRAVQNLRVVLTEAGAGPSAVVSMTITLTDLAALPDGFRAFQESWDADAEPPAVSVACVTALANPAFLVEISAIAVTGLS